jgi:hypothetical protein
LLPKSVNACAFFFPSGGTADLEAARREFATLVRGGVGIEPSREPSAPTEEPAQFDLTWSASGDSADLDLYLEIGDGFDSVVSHRRREVGEPPHARLVEDILSGPGPETVKVERWLGSTYRLWVHRYGDAELDECNPVVAYACGDLRQSFQCPAGRGSWWCVLEVDGATRELRPVNRRVEPPSALREG